jgi:hypothetical protein
MIKSDKNGAEGLFETLCSGLTEAKTSSFQQIFAIFFVSAYRNQMWKPLFGSGIKEEILNFEPVTLASISHKQASLVFCPI